MRTVTATFLARNVPKILDQVKTGERFTVTRKAESGPVAVVVSAEGFTEGGWRCGSCRYWGRVGEGDPRGYCSSVEAETDVGMIPRPRADFGCVHFEAPGRREAKP